MLTAFWMIVSQAITIADAFYIAKLYCRNNTVVQTDLDVLNFLNSHLKLPKARFTPFHQSLNSLEIKLNQSKCLLF